MKAILMVAALAVASLSYASPRNYAVVLSTPARVGRTELRAGHYLVTVKGPVAEFLNMENSQRVMVLVRVESTQHTYELTAVDTKNENGVNQIESIELGDSSSKLEF